MTGDTPLRNGPLGTARAFWGMLVAATLLGTWLRLRGLGQPSFWVDEFFTILRAGGHDLHWTNTFGYLPTRLSLWLAGAQLDRLVLENIAEWPSLGVSEAAARLGAAWVGIVSVPVLALLARPVVGGAAAGVSALLLAIAPFHLYWSQMARYYSSEFLFANVFVLGFARAMQTGRRTWFAVATGAAILAFLSHFTAIFIIGVCLGVLALAGIARVPLPHLRAGLTTLALTVGICGALLLSKELDPGRTGSLGSFSAQEWDPPLLTLVLGTILRFEPVVCVVGLAWTIVALRRRDPLGTLVGAVAVLVPLGVLALKPIFPVGQRYYFQCFFAWTLLAGMWAAEVDRRLSGPRGRLLGLTGVGVLVASVGFNAFVYTRDGAGARARWREAYEYVRQHGGPTDAVFANAGLFQAQFYLGREVPRTPKTAAEIAALPAGTWVVHRTQGLRPPEHGDLLDVRARYEIPSKPWSWVVYVMRAPQRAPSPGPR